jgi:hypothetical protein
MRRWERRKAGQHVEERKRFFLAGKGRVTETEHIPNQFDVAFDLLDSDSKPKNPKRFSEPNSEPEPNPNTGHDNARR